MAQPAPPLSDGMAVSMMIELRLHPGHIGSVSDKLKQLLARIQDKEAFKHVINVLIDQVVICEVTMIPTFANLFKILKDVTHASTASFAPVAKLSFKEAVSGCITKKIATINAADFKTFHQKLNFIVELVKLDVLQWTVVKTLCNWLFGATDEWSLRCMFELVRCIVVFVDSKVIEPTDNRLGFMKDKVMVLVAAFNKNVFKNRYVQNEISSFLLNLKERKFMWLDNSKIVINPRSAASSCQRAASAIDLTADDGSPSSSEQSADSTSVANPSSESTRLARTGNAASNAPPSIASLTPLLSVQHRGNAQTTVSATTHPPQLQQQATQNSASSPSIPVSIRSSVELLARQPLINNLAVTTATVKAILVKQSVIGLVIAAINELLDSILKVETDASFTLCVRLLENLREVVIPLADSPFTISFPEVVAKIVVKPQVITTKPQIGNLCACFRLTNELFRLNIIPRDVFQFYVEHMANHESELSYNVMFEVMRNLDRLIDAEIAHLTETEFDFWEAQTQRLSNAVLHSVFDSTLSVCITAFLDGLYEKGGWRRKLCACVHPKEEALEPSVIAVPETASTLSASHSTLPQPGRSSEPSRASITSQRQTSSPADVAPSLAQPTAVPAQPSGHQRMQTSHQNSVQVNPTSSQPNHSGARIPTPPSTLSLIVGAGSSSAQRSLTQQPSPRKSSTNRASSNGDQSNNLAPSPLQRQAPPARTPVSSSNNSHGTNKQSTSRSVVEPVSQNSSQTPQSSTPGNHNLQSPLPQVTPPVLTGLYLEDRQLIDFENLAMDITLTGGPNSPQVATAMAKLKAMTTPYKFCTSVGFLAVKMFSVIENRNGADDAASILIKFSESNYGRARCFATEIRNYCLRYFGGKHINDLERAKLETDRAILRAKTTEEKKTLIEQQTEIEESYAQNLQGCARLIGSLFLKKKFFDLQFLVGFTDTLLATGDEHAVECFKELLTWIGAEFQTAVYEAKMTQWWNAVFTDLFAIENNSKSSQKLKNLIREIFSLKQSWPEADPKVRARRQLEQMMAKLTPELLKAPGGAYDAAVEQIRAFIAIEFPDEHTQQMFAAYQRKVDRCLALVEARRHVASTSRRTDERSSTDRASPANRTCRGSRRPHVAMSTLSSGTEQSRSKQSGSSNSHSRRESSSPLEPARKIAVRISNQQP